MEEYIVEVEMDTNIQILKNIGDRDDSIQR